MAISVVSNLAELDLALAANASGARTVGAGSKGLLIFTAAEDTSTPKTQFNDNCTYNSVALVRQPPVSGVSSANCRAQILTQDNPATGSNTLYMEVDNAANKGAQAVGVSIDDNINVNDTDTVTGATATSISMTLNSTNGGKAFLMINLQGGMGTITPGTGETIEDSNGGGDTAWILVSKDCTGATTSFATSWQTARNFTSMGITIDPSAAGPTAPGNPALLPGSDEANVPIEFTNPGGYNASNGVEIHRSSTSGFTPTVGTRIAQLPGDSVSYNDSTVAADTQYYYLVVGVDGTGSTPSAAELAHLTSPAKPTSVSVTAGTSKFTISATIPTSGAELEFFVDGIAQGTLSASEMPYDYENVNNDQEYTVLLRCVKGTKYSSFAAAQSVTPVTGFAAPERVHATTLSTSAITLDWDHNDRSVTVFDIQRKKSTDPSYTSIATDISASVKEFSDTGLDPNTIYQYQVRARNGASTTAWSSVASATTLEEEPSILSSTTNPTALQNDGHVLQNDSGLGTSTWGVIHGGLGNAEDDTSSVATVRITAAVSASNWEEIYRGIVSFPLSVPPGSTLISAKLRIHGQGPVTDQFSDFLDVVGASPTSLSTLAAGDYGNLSSVRMQYNAVPLAGWTSVGYNEFLLNSEGLDLINNSLVGGEVSFGLRLRYDRQDIEPVWGSTNQTSVSFATHEGLQDPELVIEYLSGAVTYVVDETLNIGEGSAYASKAVQIVNEILNLAETDLNARKTVQIISEVLNFGEGSIYDLNIPPLVFVINETLKYSEIINRGDSIEIGQLIRFIHNSRYGAEPVHGGDLAFSRPSTAYTTNRYGTLSSYVSEIVRFAWTRLRTLNTPVMELEPGRTNKCAYTTNLSATTGWSVVGVPVEAFTVVNDADELKAAGLGAVVTNGNVLRIDARNAANEVTIQGTGEVGNTNPHTSSAYVRGQGTYNYGFAGDAGLTNLYATGGYTRTSQTQTPGAASRRFSIRVQPGSLLYIILPQLEEGAFVTTPIPNTTATSVTRASDLLYYDDAPEPSPRLAYYTKYVYAPDTVPGITIHPWIVGNQTETGSYATHYLNAAGTLAGFKGSDGSSTFDITVALGTTIQKGDRVEVLCVMNVTEAQIFVRINNGTPVSASTSTGYAIPERWTLPRVYLGGLGNGTKQGALRFVETKILYAAPFNLYSDSTHKMDLAETVSMAPGGTLLMTGGFSS